MPFIEVNQTKLYYELHGNGDEVVVLNNGVIANTATWNFQLPDLIPNFRVLLYDMRGQGQSQKWSEEQPDYTWELHAKDLAVLMDELNITHAHVGGISYGGELTLFFALHYPQKSKSLIVADAVSHVELQLKAIIESWILAAQTGDHEIFYRSMWFWNFSETFFGSHNTLLIDRIKAAQALDLPSIIQLCRCFLKFNITNKLNQIEKPTCIIVGEEDILKPRHYSETIAQEIPKSELHILPGVGHASFWEKPDEFNSIVTGFLNKNQGENP